MTPVRVLLLVCIALSSSWASAQQKPAAPPRAPIGASAGELDPVIRGWALFAQHDLVKAGAAAAQALKASPRSAAALTLAIEVEIARGGALTGLDFYERWLGQRAMEEPVVLRRIAQVTLREAAAQPQNQGRYDALVSLAADGDPAATATLSDAASSGGAEARALAGLGHPAAIGALISELNAGNARASTIEALGKSGSTLAVEPLINSLRNPRPEVRGAAAGALGRIGGPAALAALKPLLSDQDSFVRVKAAGALLRLKDSSGLPILNEIIAASPSSAIGRLIAADAMAGRPDAEWQALVRDLTQAGEPDVRLSAARLIAPHDPALARSVLEALGSDGNLAIREEAGRALAGEVAADLATLRAMLRHADPLTRSRAAGRILELTR
jgi:HEAT repeat protein